MSTETICFQCGAVIDNVQYSLHVAWHDSLLKSKFPGSAKEIDVSALQNLQTNFDRLQQDYWSLQSMCIDLEGKVAKLEAANNVVTMGLSQVEAVIGTEGDFRFVEKTQPPVKVYPLPINTGSTPYVARSSNG